MYPSARDEIDQLQVNLMARRHHPTVLLQSHGTSSSSSSPVELTLLLFTPTIISQVSIQILWNTHFAVAAASMDRLFRFHLGCEFL